MTKPMVNDGGEIREMTEAEFIQHKKDMSDLEANRNKQDKMAADKAALLAKLGITADEAALLLS